MTGKQKELTDKIKAEYLKQTKLQFFPPGDMSDGALTAIKIAVQAFTEEKAPKPKKKAGK